MLRKNNKFMYIVVLTKLDINMNSQTLKQLLKYNPDTGQFNWIAVRRGASKKGFAGTNTRIGYTQIMIDGKYYLAHRLAWLYVYGEMPNLAIDHINGIKSDNRIANLRQATALQNQHNYTKPNKNNKANLLGAFYSEKTNKWFSRICVDGKKKWLGTFDNPNDAHNAYVKAKRSMHPTCTI
jgi:hypothetical protein